MAHELVATAHPEDHAAVLHDSPQVRTLGAREVFCEQGLFPVLAAAEEEEVAAGRLYPLSEANVDDLDPRSTVIVLGGLLGSYYGFQEFGVCLEGQTYHIPRGNFDLKVDKFWIDYHENGAVKSYNSTLTVLESGETKITTTLVNRSGYPLKVETVGVSSAARSRA